MEIKPENSNLEKIFFGLNTKYEVPEYQRDYSWTRDEIEELWSDIHSSLRTNSEYFLGTIVLNKENHNEDQYDIVDGQQRLATFTILFSAIRALAKNFISNDNIFPLTPRNSANNELASKILSISQSKLVYVSEPNNYYLKMNIKDEKIFKPQILIDETPIIDDEQLVSSKTESRIIKAKKYIYKKIKDEYFNTNDAIKQINELLIHVIKKLRFITITVQSDYDAYLLFESLNSKGMDLSTADLLKNKMLMVCSDEQSKKEVLENWDLMNNCLKESIYSNQVDFIRCYWQAYEDKNVTKKELYKCIKNKIVTNGFNIVGFSENIHNKSELYVDLTSNELDWPSTNYPANSLEQYLAEINTLRYTICLPALLYAKSERPADLHIIAKSSLSYLFRLITIGDYAIGKASQTFTNILDALKANSDIDDILDLFKQESSIISDDKFTEAFMFYQTKSSSVAKYILAKLHLYCQGNEQIPNLSEIHLEHILPQEYSIWESAGFDANGRKYDDLVYHIGNMTLLNKKGNQKIQNKVFSEKILQYKKKEAGEDGTTFEMTYRLYDDFISGKTDWTVDRIEKRAKEWAEIVPSVWPL